MEEERGEVQRAEGERAMNRCQRKFQASHRTLQGGKLQAQRKIIGGGLARLNEQLFRSGQIA